MEIDLTLSVLFVNNYNENKRKGTNYIPDTAVVKAVMLPMYEKLVREGLIPIENLSEEGKRSLMAECRRTGENYTNKTLIEQCKILYLIKTINGTKTDD